MPHKYTLGNIRPAGLAAALVSHDIADVILIGADRHSVCAAG